MKIVMDLIVSEFLKCNLAGLFEEAEEMDKCHEELDERSREDVIMELLEGIVACGAATHVFNERENADEFLATARLVQAWGEKSNRTKIKKPAKRSFHVAGDRSRYFNENWLAPGKHDPLPNWWT